MNIRNAKYINLEKTGIDVEIEHPKHGWIPYTLYLDTDDSSFDKYTREELKSMEISFDESEITKESTLFMQSEFRAERNQLLFEVDIMINKAEDNGEDTTALRAYRQALRDATIDWIMPTLEA